MKKITALNIILLFTLFSFNAPAWPSPTQINPLNGALVPTGIKLDWAAVFNSERYELQVDTSPSFNSPLFFTITKNYINAQDTNPDTQHFIDDLYFGTVYYWRVRAWVPGDTSIWNQRNFTTRDFVNPNSPSSGSNTWTGVRLDWLAHDGVDFYDVEIDTTLQFNSPAYKTASKVFISASSANLDTEHFFDDLYFGFTYYWRVRARNAVDTCSWSTIWTINTRDFVTLVDPTDGQTNVNSSGVLLNWDAHHGINIYQLQFDSVDTFNSPFLATVNKNYLGTSNNSIDTQHATGTLAANTTYYWRVRAINAVDTSAWTTWSFSTANCANPGPISGSSAVCQNSSATYSVTPVTGATSYNWTLPSGWTGSSTSNIITVSAGTTGGVISVTVNNPCGTSSAQTITVSIDSLLGGPIGSISGQMIVCENALASYFLQPVPGATSYIWTTPAGWTGTTTTNNLLTTVNNQPGLVTVTAINACDTSATASISVTISPLPAQPVLTSGDTIVCAGSTQIYSINSVPGATAYTWNLPAGWTGGTSGTSITVQAGVSGGVISVTAQNSCGSSQPLTIPVSVNVIDASVQVNGIVLTANATNATYQWLDCDNNFAPIPGETNQSFTPLVNGSYAVALVQNGCADTSSCIAVTSVGVDFSDGEIQYTLYPNPHNGIFNISYPELKNEALIIIYDHSGRVIHTEILPVKSSGIQLTLQNLSSGIYYCKFRSDEIERVVKMSVM
jgi:hypothetical protein